jgi:hypothetical protein
MLLCKFYTQLRRKTREGEKERVFIRCFSIKNYTTVLFFLFFFFLARTFIFHYISIVILYVFLSLFLVLMFFHFSFCPFFFFFLFVLFFLSIYINQFWKKTRERVSIHCFSMKNYTKFFFLFFFLITIIFYFPIVVSQ